MFSSMQGSMIKQQEYWIPSHMQLEKYLLLFPVSLLEFGKEYANVGGRLVSCNYSFAFGPSNIVVKGNKSKRNVAL